ncbi:hypothetical protein [Lysinibacillus parviboronicapiens]|uniref:hypothetical protein n=1 Tax=Lysinibacillus parviboronicapiens TaxID=436516 RepID=UPI001EE775F2|nr:hypothetical protein [Lysinibacillus parviboronicapiens]
MGSSKKITSMGWSAFFIVIFVIVGGVMYYVYFFTTKNSLELYQEISFLDNFEEVQKLMLEGYEENFNEEDFHFIKDHSANRIGQFTLLEFEEKTFVIMTTPGAKNLKVLEVDELPEDIRKYFLALAQ